MNQRLPASPDSQSGRQKAQKIGLQVLYVALVLLALWIVRSFIPAVVWASVIAIALWPLLRRVESHHLFQGRTTVIAFVFTAAVSVLVVLPIGLGIAQALNEAHDLLAWFRDAQENGVPVPDFVGHLPFGVAQVTAWWQTNLEQPLRGSAAMKGLHSDAVLTFGRHFGARAVHVLVVFGFMLVTLFMILQAGPKLSDTLLTGARRAFGPEGARLIQRMAGAVRSTVTGLVVVGFGEGVLLGIVYAIVGVPHAALLGLVTAVAAMLPFCAPIVFCCAALWLFAQGSVAGAIGL
ncbi:MAG: AI-2E family transporter, partial [Paraburkholderia sp.]|uniref:AI-2E family transporter n=1 Tax=Paraburkholderia sp. TaxID=1926495 RepID=UPI00121C80C1